jgi:hypothetical protein
MNETVNCPVCRETFCTKQDVSLSIYLEMNTTALDAENSCSSAQ